MYNRYIPQPDGSFRRSRVQEPPAMPPRRVSEAEQNSTCADPEVPRASGQAPGESPGEVCKKGIHPVHRQPTAGQRRSSHPASRPCPVDPKRECAGGVKPTGVSDFLKNLLPRDFDTGDLLIVLLLLLMSGDCAEDQNSAMLTLALYLFL